MKHFTFNTNIVYNSINEELIIIFKDQRLYLNTCNFVKNIILSTTKH